MTIEMQPRPSGKPTLSERIVRRLSELGPKHSRRSFFTRAAVAGSALAVNPLNYVLKPGTAYAQTTCGPGATCGEGWSVFCCTINNGQNACPPGSFVAGWWKADSSSYCGGGPRYIVDCNQMCGEPCTCYCPTGTCDNRRTCCNQFRYGQCHQEITCAGPVRCRMVMCVPPWQFDATCTTASATDNRTGEHNAPCNTSQPPPPPPPPVYPPPARANTWLAANADGRLELFHVGTDGAIWNRWQGTKNGGFTGNGRVGGRFPLGSEVVVGRNSDGRMEVFCVAANGNVHHMWQSTAGGGWSGVASLGGWIVKPLGIGHNADGRLELFGLAINNQLYHCYQLSPNGMWSDWQPLTGVPLASPPTAARNADGRMEVFAIGTDNQLWHRYQVVPNGGWSTWQSLGGSCKPLRPAVTPYGDGRLHVAVVGTDGAVWHIAQVVPNGGWNTLTSLGGSTNQPVALGANADGRHEVFIIEPDFDLVHSWESGGGWSPYASFGGGMTRWPAVYPNADGRLDLVVVGGDKVIWRTAQVAPNDIWTPLTQIGGVVP